MRLLGPVQMLRVKSLDGFQRKVAALARALEVQYPAGVYIARVEHGRWIADCPCGAGVAVHPTWSETGCLECGRWWPVMVPSEWDAIESVLLARPKRDTRNWLTLETVEKLRAENVAHGLPEVIGGPKPRVTQDGVIEAFLEDLRAREER